MVTICLFLLSCFMYIDIFLLKNDAYYLKNGAEVDKYSIDITSSQDMDVYEDVPSRQPVDN